MSNTHLNLARKWRSKRFDELVGQDLIVRLIKNSLYRDLIFPVYLFSGQKGCGKTSTARIYASALNCFKLKKFQQHPKDISIPCLECDSCIAMQKLAHPDFIEIDAASHTGVDNVRQIIDAASFIPVMGKKKIYLIDEAHMLSKAAFSALLKILEEPPPSILFFLATTDPHKILDTIRSRCFQLFFNPVSTQELSKHLEFICQKEGIEYDCDGLLLISQETEGSVRDALNLIERIRLVNNKITKSTVFETLGYIDDETLSNLFISIVQKTPQEFLNLYNQINFKKFDSQVLWKRIIEIIRYSLWIKSGVDNEIPKHIVKLISPTLKICSINLLIKMLETCYSYEFTFSKTSYPHQILEMLLIKLSQLKEENFKIDDSDDKNFQNKKFFELKKNEDIFKFENNSLWQSFLNEIEQCDDPLVFSIFKQAKIKNINDNSNYIELNFSRDLFFFKEWIDSTTNVWRPIFKKYFGSEKELNLIFDGEQVNTQSDKLVVSKRAETPIEEKTNINKKSTGIIKNNNNNKEIQVNLSDIKDWPKVGMLIKVFPGVVSYATDDKIFNEEVQ